MAKTYKKDSGIIRAFDLKSPTTRIFYFIIIVVSIIMVLLSVLPVLWVFLASFKDIKEFTRQPTLLPATFQFEKFAKTWNDLKFFKYYLNSLYAVIGSVVCAVVFNGLLAYSISKLKPAGHKFVLNLVMWSLMIPATTSIVPLFVNIKNIGLSGTFVPIWFVMGANAFFVILYKNFFDGLPQSLIEAARIDGCNDLQIFFRIVLPLSMAINMVIVIYAINGAWSDFLLPYLVLGGSGHETVMVKLFQFRNGKSSDVDVLRAVAFAIIPPVVLFSVFQKWIMQGVADAGIKG